MSPHELHYVQYDLNSSAEVSRLQVHLNIYINDNVDGRRVEVMGGRGAQEVATELVTK